MVLVIITITEFFVYLGFYILLYFIKEGGYIPGTFIRVGYNLPFLIISILRVGLDSIVIPLIIAKTILVFRNLYLRNFIKTSLLSEVITFLNPLILTFIYLFIHTATNIFVLRQPTASALTYANTVLFLAPIPLLIAFWMFNKFRRQEYILLGTPLFRKENWLTWAMAIASTLFVIGIVFGAQKGINYIKAEALKKSAIQEKLGILVSEKDTAQPIKVNLTKITNDANFGVTFEWDSITPGVELGTRLLVILYIPVPGTFPVQEGSSCTVQKNSAGSYSCFAQFYSSPPGGNFQDKEIYSFFIDKSTLKSVRDRDEKRKTDLKKLQAAFFEYKKVNGRYPCSGEYQNCREGEELITFKERKLPRFNWEEYQDPLPTPISKKYYSVFTTTTTADINLEPPSFLAYAVLEISSQSNRQEFFCIDNDGEAKVVTRRPKPIIIPYSCNNLWSD